MSQQLTIQLPEGKPSGRPECLTKSQVLHAIYHYSTASPTELVRCLNKDGFDVSRRTIYRRLEGISPEIIDAILAQTTDDELKPRDRSQTAFFALPIVKQYSETLLHVRETSPSYHNMMMNGLFWLCQTLNKNPTALQNKESVDLCARLIMQIKKGEVQRNLESAMTAIRSWYLFIGIAGSYLTGKGITGERRGRGKRSRVKLTMEERHKFVEVVESKFSQDVTVESNGRTIGMIPFYSQPETQQAMIMCVKFLYYTGTRREATLEAKWGDVTWGKPITLVHVIDKGAHKLGRIEWDKKIAGEFLSEFEAYWQGLGCPKEGRIFPFRGELLSCFFAQIHEEAGIPKKKWERMPVHVWRHTACQDYLYATNWNEKQAAKVLGWESTDTMRKHYGEASESVIDRGLMMAMGLPVPLQEKKEFKF